MQTLRTLYLHGILLPMDLFMAERSVLKRASWWSLKQMIMLSGSWDIGNLVSGDLVITDWSADNLVNTDCFETFLVLFEKVFLRAFGGHLDHQNCSSIPRVMCRTIDSDHVVGCSGAQTTTIMYLRTVCLRINLRLNNIFCYCLNFAFLSLLIIKSSTYKSVSGYL